MRTLCMRHVPYAVAERLERLASFAGVPLSTFVLQELIEAATAWLHALGAGRPAGLHAGCGQRRRFPETGGDSGGG